MPDDIERSWYPHAPQVAVFYTTPDGSAHRETITLIRPEHTDPHARSTWRPRDDDGQPLPDVTGDYLDAEAALIAASQAVTAPAAG